jgi:DnaJ-class molecular chaperone
MRGPKCQTCDGLGWFTRPDVVDPDAVDPRITCRDCGGTGRRPKIVDAALGGTDE